ncbi:ADP-ribosyltransferase [Nocardiopsis sp. CC223A]|uniref:ADP-ribosyltransferase n=1 Tax=Nocardiopsis sp. CC223A TaxID=3044051 RepID=UPI00278C734F|nr:ADP-ribosyltransferase [Nocardiopsis sp. CC223A]
MPSSTPWDSGGAYACLPNGAVDPTLIPIPDVDPDELEATATKLTGTGGDIGRSGTDITGSWAGLSGVYSAPEAETLFAKMDPVGSDTADVQDAVGTAADALSTFAEEAREIKARLVSLKGRAEDLRAEIGTDEDWADDDDLRGRNNALNNQVADAVFEYQYAERNCANKITGLFGGTYFAGWSELSPEVPGRTRDGRERAYYGTFKPLVDAANPWGSPVDAPPAGGILGDGLAALGDLGAGALLGLGATTGMYRDGQMAYPFGTEWQQNMGAHFGELGEGYATLTGFYVDGQWTGHDSVDEWYFHFSGAAGELVGSYFAYDQWEDRPAYSITTGIANTALLAGGVGVFKFLLDNPAGIGNGPDLGEPSPDFGNGSSSNGGHHGGSGERPGGSSLPGQEGFGGGNDGTPSLTETRQTLSDLNDLNGTNRSSGPSGQGTGTADPGTPSGQGTSGTDTNATPSASGTNGNGSTSNDPWAASPVNGTDPALSSPNTANGADPSSSHPANANGVSGGSGGGGGSVTNGTDANGTGANPVDPNTPANADPGSGSTDGGENGGDPQSVTGGQDPNGGQQSGSNTGTATSPTDGTTAHPLPAPPPDPTASYPGHLDAEGIRRFADESEVDAYAQQVLLDPTVNPHAFDNLPAEQRDAVLKYTTNSWVNAVARAGDSAAGQRLLDSWVDRVNSAIASGDMRYRGWDLYELNGRVRPTLNDLVTARSRTDLTPNQRSLVEEVLNHRYPHLALNHWLSRSGPLGAAAETNGGRYPDVNDAHDLMADLDPAVARPLPEGVEAVRGLHSLDHLDGFDPNDPYALVGTDQTETGYMSTSLGSNLTTVDGKPFPYTVNLKVPPGAEGLWVGERSRYPSQRELILARGTEYHIDNVRHVGGRWIIDATITVS